MGLILDTSILIASERRGQPIEDILRYTRAVHGEVEVALSVISVVEDVATLNLRHFQIIPGVKITAF
jgi:hypothetical protein